MKPDNINGQINNECIIIEFRTRNSISIIYKVRLPRSLIGCWWFYAPIMLRSPFSCSGRHCSTLVCVCVSVFGVSPKSLQCQPSLGSILRNQFVMHKIMPFVDWFTRCIFISSCWICIKLKRERERDGQWKKDRMEKELKINVNIHACMYERHLYVVFLIRCHQSQCAWVKSVEISCFSELDMSLLLIWSFSSPSSVTMYKSIDVDSIY